MKKKRAAFPPYAKQNQGSPNNRTGQPKLVLENPPRKHLRRAELWKKNKGAVSKKRRPKKTRSIFPFYQTNTNDIGAVQGRISPWHCFA